MNNSIPRHREIVNTEELDEFNRTVLQHGQAMHAAWTRKMRIDVETAFEIADIYNKHILGNNRAMNIIAAQYGANANARWVEFARVGRKWNGRQRKEHIGRKPWTWFRNNNVEGPDVPRQEKNPVSLAAISEEVIEGVPYYRIKVGKRQFVVGPPKLEIDDGD